MTDFELDTEKFAGYLKSLGKQPATISSYKRDIKKLEIFLRESRIDKDTLDQDGIRAFIEWLETHDKHNSVRRNIIGVRQYYRFLADSDGSWESPFDSIIIPVRDESLPDGLEEEDLECIEAAALSQKGKFKRSRDLSIVRLLALEGVKASELLAIEAKHLLLQNTSGSLKIEGLKARMISLQVQTVQALISYMKHYKDVAAKNQFKYLFLSFKGRDLSLLSEPMTRHGLKFLLYELGAESGIKHLNSELLRHFAINFQIGLGKTSAEIMAHFGLKRLGNIGKHLRKQTEGKRL